MDVKLVHIFNSSWFVHIICTYNDFYDLDLKCISNPRTDSKKLLCSDGETSSTWGGCSNRDAPRIQCKKDHYPCNQLKNDNEFICSLDCSSRGGIRDCQMNGE